jgi:hypothetical protein
LEYKLVPRPGNSGPPKSGLLLHIGDPQKIWPNAFEVQLGEIPGAFVTHGKTHTLGHNPFGKPTDKAKPVGEWNRVWITSKHNNIEVHINDTQTAFAQEVLPRKGFIGLKADGHEIHFRNIKIMEFAPSNNPDSAAEPPPNLSFQPLFNGKDLSGWEFKPPLEKGEMPPEWQVKNEVLHFVPKGNNHWLRTIKPYQNYVLELEYGMTPKCGKKRVTLVLHQSTKGLTSDESGYIGLALTVESDRSYLGPHGSGSSVIGKPYHFKTTKPEQQWNKLTLIAQSGTIEWHINGEKMGCLGVTPTEGHIALAATIDGEGLFRNIRIKELPPSPPPDFQPLFNGKNLSGWEGNTTKLSWQGGALVWNTPFAKEYVRSKKVFKDFELKFEAQLDNSFCSAGVLVRGKAGVPIGPFKHVGCFSTVYSIGKYLHWPKNKDTLEKVQKVGFNEYHVRCVGKHVTLRVNGITTIDDDFAELAEEGTLGFLMLSATDLGAQLTIRNIFIRELAPPLAPAFKPLFNGKDLTGWKAASNKKGVDPTPAWSVSKDLLVCKGKPSGYLHTEKKYEDYILSFEWNAPKQFVPNECLLYLHVQDPGPGFPDAVNVNLFASGKIITFILSSEKISNLTTIEPESGNEPAEDWKKVVLVCKGDSLEIQVNGKSRYSASGLIWKKGYIALRSAGQEVRFRNIEIKELPTSK